MVVQVQEGMVESIWREWRDYSKQGKRECVGMNGKTENSQMKRICASGKPTFLGFFVLFHAFSCFFMLFHAFQ